MYNVIMVFEVISKLDRRIRLTGTQWLHIESKHKELSNQQEKMISALMEPDAIYYSPTDDNHHYYKHFKETPITEKYLLLVVKLLNKDGFIVTAFFVSKIRTKNKEAIYGQENFYQL